MTSSVDSNAQAMAARMHQTMAIGIRAMHTKATACMAHAVAQLGRDVALGGPMYECSQHYTHTCPRCACIKAAACKHFGQKVADTRQHVPGTRIACATCAAWKLQSCMRLRSPDLINASTSCSPQMRAHKVIASAQAGTGVCMHHHFNQTPPHHDP